ncbi:F-box/kelch-repeat protein at3g23880-like protein [Trifolium pratense]|uniref:F-box/kelch-repeat protein at3g23880-like protein n=1 Tax=Trifolium pratense TaxID=57577 RepID=A0A2K3N805_TRIPR|nr:F-box/kelch-repeat protein at3g23880-like protein [Trifolium pratense]
MSDNYQSSTAKCFQQPPPFLPEKIRILLRLPVRSLLEYKCICKSWKTLISDPKFAKRQLHILMVNPSIYQHIFSSRFFDSPRKIVSFPVKPLLENPIKPIEFCMENRFKSKKSPTLDSCNKRMLVPYHGFGYDHINDKYKLLVASYDSEKLTQIYTFGGTNSWTTIQNFPSATSFDGKFVSASGTLNWVIVKSGVSVSSNQGVILSFDLVNETYKEVLLPEHDGDEIRNARLGVWSDCICIDDDPPRTLLLLGLWWSLMWTFFY